MPVLSNHRHELFAREYARTGVVMRSALAVGFVAGYGDDLAARTDISERVTELRAQLLQASDITPQRVMMELGRIAFSDVRKVFGPDGQLIPVHELDDDAAAAITGIEHETRTERDGFTIEIDLVTGEETKTPRFITVRTAKIKRANKDAALATLAKHFKLVGDEGDGVNALANALADRLKTARKRTLQDVTDIEPNEPESLT